GRAGDRQHHARRPSEWKSLMTLLEAVPQATTPAVALPTLLLSGMVWVPALAGIGVLFFPTRTDAHRERIRSFAIGASALVLGLAVVMWYGFRDQSGTFAYEETRPWLPGAGSSYHLGVDGVSMAIDRKSTRLNSSHLGISY